MNLYYINGIRHHAVVIAHNKTEATERALNAAQKKDPFVLHGYIGNWECPPEIIQLTLPKEITLSRKRQYKSSNRGVRVK